MCIYVYIYAYFYMSKCVVITMPPETPELSLMEHHFQVPTSKVAFRIRL